MSESTARRPVLLLAETGYLIRDLLLGEFAKSICEHTDLIAAVPDPNDSLLLEQIQGLPIRLIHYERESTALPSTKWRRLFSGQQIMYRLREAEKSTDSLRLQMRLFSQDEGRLLVRYGRALTKMARWTNALGLVGFFEKFHLHAISKGDMAAKWRKTLHELQPSVVVSTFLTHRTLFRPSSDLHVVSAAHSLGLPCGTLVQSWDNLSSKTSVLPPWLNRYWCWSETMAQELLQLSPRLRSAQAHVVGSPHFDYHLDPRLHEPRDTFLPQLGLDPHRPYILIGTGVKDWIPGEPLVVADLAERLRHKLPHVHVLLRLHPKDRGDRWQAVQERLNAAGVLIHRTAPDKPMDGGGFEPPLQFFRSQVNELRHAAAVIQFSSTMTVDAAILDRPVVTIGYDCKPDPSFPEGRALAYTRSTHYGRLVATGGVTVAKSADEAVSAIKAYLANPALHQAERARLVSTVTDGIGDGGRRLAVEVLSLASGR